MMAMLLQMQHKSRRAAAARRTAGGSTALVLPLVLLLVASLLEGALALSEYLDVAAVGRMETALDETITIQASPGHLPKGGLWVTIEWSGVSNPTDGDFIAAYAPLDAQPDATAPVKYQYAAAADQGHLQRGAGRVKFRLLEYVGGGYWFGFFRGNASHPVFVAKSGPVTIGGGDGVHEPQGIHLALTDKADEMRVTWKTQESFFFVPDAEAAGVDEIGAAVDAMGEGAVSSGVNEEGDVTTAAVANAAVAAAVVEKGGEEKGMAAAALAPAAADERKKQPRRRRRRMAAAIKGTQEVQYAKASDVSGADGQLDAVAWSSTKATVGAFARGDLCGEPATGAGWSDPGSVHSAMMRGLEAGTAYTYRVGNAEHDAWSPTYTFTTAPSAAASQVTTRGNGALTRVAVMADMSSGEGDGSLQAGFFANDLGSLDTARAVGQLVEAGQVDVALCIGDLSYSTGFLSRWDSWLNMMQPIAARVPFMTAPGNHERDDTGTSPFYADGTTSLWAKNDAGGECGVPYAAYFPMPGPAAYAQDDAPWYSFQWGALHFSVMSTEHDFREGSLQHTWLKHDLAAVDRERTPWLVLVAHRPFYLDSTDDANPYDPLSPSEQNGARLLRKHVEPLLLQHRVDLVLSGHHHSYQRTCKVAGGACLAPAAHLGATYQAPVHAVLGTAGRRLSTNFETTVPSIFEAVHGSAYGAVVLEADGSQLSLTFRDALTDAIVDQVYISLPLEHGAEEENDDEAYHKNNHRLPARRGKKRPLPSSGSKKGAFTSVLLRLLGLLAVIALVAVELGYASGTLRRGGSGGGVSPGGSRGGSTTTWLRAGGAVAAGFRPKSQSSPRPSNGTEMTPLVTGAGDVLDGSGSGSGGGTRASKRYRTGSTIPIGGFGGDSAV